MSKMLRSYLFKTNLSAFRAAILANNTNRICRILDAERDYINKEIDNEGNTALLLAIKYASPSTVQLLVRQGTDPDQTNFITGQTPLSLLASIVDDIEQTQETRIALEMATILLDHHAYVDKPSPYQDTDDNGNEYFVNETPLMTAIRTKNLPMATLLVDKGANVNYIDKHSDNRPIHYAIMNGDEDVFDLLENAGASCRTVVTNGDNTLLHWFCYNSANDQHPSVLEKLIAKGCDINAENNLQRTPLMLAAKLNMINTCELLLNAHADIHQVDYKGYRAIDLTKLGSECFRVLLHMTQVQQMKSSSHHRSDRIVCKKQITHHRPLRECIREPANDNNTKENKIKPDSSNITCKEIKNVNQSISSYNETDRRYKRMWTKILHTKQRIIRTKDLSVRISKNTCQQTTNGVS